jgi:hypothetical protein
MLEHAEISIQEATSLAKSSALSKSDDHTKGLKDFIGVVTALWPAEDLPDDKRRLADNLMDVASMVRLDAAGFRTFLEAEAAAGRGPKTLNLSPYGSVIQSLIDHKTADFEKGLAYRAKQPPNRLRPILITREIVVPDALKSPTWDKATLTVS